MKKSKGNNVAKTLLRSGNLDDYQAVGGGGQAVFDSALQIRETLRLRKQQAMVDCLAIPQINDNGDRVDWYSPVEGKAVAWKTADEEARFRALRYLGSTLENAAALSRKACNREKPPSNCLVHCSKSHPVSSARTTCFWLMANPSLRSGASSI